MFSRASILWIKNIFILLMKLMSSSKKWFSLLLFLIRDHFLVEMYLSEIEILTEMGHGWMLISSQDECGAIKFRRGEP